MKVKLQFFFHQREINLNSANLLEILFFIICYLIQLGLELELQVQCNLVSPWLLVAVANHFFISTPTLLYLRLLVVIGMNNCCKRNCVRFEFGFRKTEIALVIMNE